MEDDIYFVPGEKPLLVKEVETETGQNIDMAPKTHSIYNQEGNYSDNSAVVINRQKGTVEKVDMNKLDAQAREQLESNALVNNTTIYQNTGYWIGGLKGVKAIWKKLPES